jgi:hypothetical protein
MIRFVLQHNSANIGMAVSIRHSITNSLGWGEEGERLDQDGAKNNYLAIHRLHKGPYSGLQDNAIVDVPPVEKIYQ